MLIMEPQLKIAVLRSKLSDVRTLYISLFSRMYLLLFKKPIFYKSVASLMSALVVFHPS